MRSHLKVAAVVLPALIYAITGLAQVTVEKSLLFSNSAIHDLYVFRAGPDKTNILVLTGRRGRVWSLNGTLEKEFEFRPSYDMRASQNANEECIVFSTGKGSGEAFAATLNGEELWSFKLRDQYVYTTLRHADGRFFVCTWYDGVRIFDRNGKNIGSLNEALLDIDFSPKHEVVTLSLSYAGGRPTSRARTIQLEKRDKTFKVLKTFPVESHTFKIVASNWPRTNNVWYVSETHLVCLDESGKKLASIPHAHKVIGTHGCANAALFEDDTGKTYLGLSVIHVSGTSPKSKLIIVSDNRETVYEELLFPSRAVGSFGTSLYVDVRNEIYEYRLRNKATNNRR